MSNLKSIRFFLYRYGYLLLTAAWLFTFSYLFQFYWSYTSAPEQVSERIAEEIHSREKDFESLFTNTALLSRLAEHRNSESDFEQMRQKDYFIFLATESDGQPQIQFWNTQTILPDPELWNQTNPVSLQKLINGYYVVRMQSFQLNSGKPARLIALIPVKWDYFITTHFLNNSFAYLSSLGQYFNISTTEQGAFTVRSASGRFLFWMTVRPNYPKPLSIISILLRFLAVISLLVFLHKATSLMATRHSFRLGFSFLVFVLLSVRILSYFLPLPLNFRQFELFDPAIYGSNFILKSLGDLLLNLLLLLWVLFFIHRYQPVQTVRVKQNIVIAFLLAVFIYSVTVLLGSVVKSLINDSQISFHVTNFFSLNVYSFIGFIVLACITLSFYLIVQRAAVYYALASGQKAWLQVLLIVVTGFLYLTGILDQPQVFFNMGLLGWLLLVLLLLHRDRNMFAFLPSGGQTVFWVFFYSVSLMLLLIVENANREQEDRKRIAEKLSVQTDPAAENLLSIALANFRGDFLRDEFYRFRTSGSSRVLKDSLLGEHFTGYLNKYDTRFFTYSAEEQPLFNDDSTSFNALNAIYDLQSKPTSVRDWRYYEESFDRYYYIARRVVTDTSGVLPQGFVFIISKPGRYADDKFHPELFSKQYRSQSNRLSDYSYAVYKKGRLITANTDYAFPVLLNNQSTKSSGFESKKKNGFSELWYTASADRTVVVVRSNAILIEAITLFAWIFFVFLLLWAIYRMVRLFLKCGLNWSLWRQQLQLNFRTQVLTTIIVISIFSFVVIGVSTIIFFINRHDRTNKERLSRTMQIMLEEVNLALQQHAVFDDILKVYDQVASEELQARLNRISDIHGVDVNVYDPNGDLKVSSQPYYYNKGLLSRKMNPSAYYRLSRKMQVQAFENERVGTQAYMSIYAPVRDSQGHPYAYVNIPYFTSQNELKQEISSFLVTLINLNAFIFLIAGLIAFLVTNRITASFLFISEKMKEMKLGRSNQAIVWNRKDEIGELVQEYNRMVNQLDESVALLAKSEREGAWREMARQVAHEIKNPLTPMKLSIQYLQKAVDSNATEVKLISQNVARTLVEQIDYLSNIASDFSNFANITNQRIEEVNLSDSLKSVVDLFTMDERVDLYFDLAMAEKIVVLGDKTQLNRLFTNLIRNAIDAVPTSRRPRIQLGYTIDDGYAVVEVRDNGTGIPDELTEKIFYPNFTTKTSGTGLGLAMCKGIVEQMKGEIWFTTKLNEGSSFFVKIPRVQKEMN